jgi:DNA-directed RNA polymerase specialized sigma24 family protein
MQLTDTQRVCLDRLVQQHWDAIRWRVRCRASLRGLDPDEVLGETLSWVARYFSTFDPRRGSFLTWVGRVVESVTISMLRAIRARGRCFSLPQRLAGAGSAPARLELMQAAGATRALPGRVRAAVGLTGLGYTRGEVGRVFGVSRQSVHLWLRQARQLMVEGAV